MLTIHLSHFSRKKEKAHEGMCSRGMFRWLKQLNGLSRLETDQYIKQEERKKLEKLRAEVRCMFRSVLPLWESVFIFDA